MTAHSLPNRLRDAANVWPGSELARLLDEAADALKPPAKYPFLDHRTVAEVDAAPCCAATQQSDEMFCARCRLRWDVNDPEPPSCRA